MLLTRHPTQARLAGPSPCIPANYAGQAAGRWCNPEQSFLITFWAGENSSFKTGEAVWKVRMQRKIKKLDRGLEDFAPLDG
jgi:hypothetical protein